MNRYVNNEHRTLKKVLINIIIILTIIVIGIYVYYMYDRIEIQTSDTNQVEITRTSQIAETAGQNNDISTISDIIEQVNLSIVGISKIQNAGSSIFLEESASKLGLGTGVIVSQNGYILTNWHVAGEKYSNCYVTLENRKNI